MRRLVILLGLAASFAIAETGGAAGQATLTGQVLGRGAGLSCLRDPCWKPMAKVPVTILREQQVVTRALSGPDGRFRVGLAPGVYTLRAPGLVAFSRNPALPVTGWVRVSLRAGQTARLTLVIRPSTAGKVGVGYEEGCLPRNRSAGKGCADLAVP